MVGCPPVELNVLLVPFAREYRIFPVLWRKSLEINPGIRAVIPYFSQLPGKCALSETGSLMTASSSGGSRANLKLIFYSGVRSNECGTLLNRPLARLQFGMEQVPHRDHFRPDLEINAHVHGARHPREADRVVEQGLRGAAWIKRGARPVRSA